ncbi:MAG: hypothetical protein AAFR24_15630 [Cyanobacteria bacterium J06627_3]
MEASVPTNDYFVADILLWVEGDLLQPGCNLAAAWDVSAIAKSVP